MTIPRTSSRWLTVWALFLLTLLYGTIAQGAGRATPAEVAAAIRSSPNASPWLRANADAVGSLAAFESGGRLDVYNGSCCYGILQMNTDNIDRYAGVKPEVFRTWGLQQQVDAWSKLTSDALQASAPGSLIAMGTFDGRVVDGNLVLACVQLGIGNCQRMIDSGRCSGFADSNGTTICAMADRIAGGNGAGSGGGSGGSGGSGSASGGGTWTPPSWSPPSCVRGQDGGCMSMSEAMRAGFQAGSGVSMDRLRSLIQLLLVLVTMLVVGSAMVGVWQNYAKGAIAKADLLLYMQRGLIVVGMVFVIMTLF